MSSAPSTNNNTSIKAKVDLRSPTRPIHVGVILLGGTTEILDIAPIDLLHGLTKESLDIFPPGSIPEEMRKQAIEIVFHYVSEKGGMAKLTSGLTVECTVRSSTHRRILMMWYWFANTGSQDTFTSCPPLDICLIGATLDNPPYTPTPGEIQYLRDTYYSPTLQSLLTICGGMVPALQAGLLEGKRATAPRMMIPMFKGMASGDRKSVV